MSGMKSELGFLMDLFLSEEVPLPIKKMVADRIRDVEGKLNAPSVHVQLQQPLPQWQAPVSAEIAKQAPSMQRIIAAHPDVPIPVATPAAAQALAQRANAIHSGMSEKAEAGRTSPRKF